MIQWFSCTRKCVQPSSRSILEHRHHLREKPILFTPLPFTPNPPNCPSSHQPLTYLVSINFPILGMSYKGSHVTCGLLWPDAFTGLHVLKVHPWGSRCSASFLSVEEHSTVWPDHIWSTPSLVNGRLGCFHLWALTK